MTGLGRDTVCYSILKSEWEKLKSRFLDYKLPGQEGKVYGGYHGNQL